jgi:hypothetical protein
MSLGTISRASTSAHQRWLAFGLLIIFVILSFQYIAKVGDENRSAILRWRPQIQQLYELDIYQRYVYPNPPIMALLLKPLIELPPLAGSLLWFYLKVGMTFVALYWAFRLVERPGVTFPSWAKTAAVLLSLRPILGDLSHGNVNLFILFLTMGALYAFLHGRDLTAGLTLGLAIACKVTPALFIPYFLWKRAWRTLAGCAAGLTLFLVVVPGLFLGMARNLELTGSWYERMVKPFVVGGEVTTDHPNQSLPGLVYRWLTPSPSFYDKGVPHESSNVAEVNPIIVRWVVKGCMALFAALVIWTCRTPCQPRHGWRLSAEFSVILLGMLLFSERTWKHHCVTHILPFAVLVYYLSTCRPGAWMRGYLIATLGAVTILMTAAGTGLMDEWNRTARLAQADGAYVWANLLLTAALMAVLARRDSAGSQADVPVPIRSQTSAPHLVHA